MKGILRTDGGARPSNPGHAAFACVLEVGGKTHVISRYIGKKTNNYAEYCNPPEAPVVMGDFSTKLLGDIETGDRVLGWDYPDIGYRKYVRSIVVAKRLRRARVVCVELESGQEIICTADHLWAQPQWLNHRGNLVYRSAEVGRNIYRVVADVDDLKPPTDSESSYWRGWLAGIYDGEGSRNTIAQSPDVNPAQYERIGTALTKLGFKFSFNPMGYVILGGREEIFRFAAWCNPSKMVSDDYWIKSFSHTSRGKNLMTAEMAPDRVVSIKSTGIRDVVSLQTESGNYNAWGLASKNCGVLVGVKLAIDQGVTNLEIITDSKLIVGQMTEGWKVNNHDLGILHTEVTKILKHYTQHGGKWSMRWEKRSNNSVADSYCTQAIIWGWNLNPFTPQSVKDKRGVGKIIDPYM